MNYKQKLQKGFVKNLKISKIETKYNTLSASMIFPGAPAWEELKWVLLKATRISLHSSTCNLNFHPQKKTQKITFQTESRAFPSDPFGPYHCCTAFKIRASWKTKPFTTFSLDPLQNWNRGDRDRATADLYLKQQLPNVNPRFCLPFSVPSPVDVIFLVS